MDSVSFGAACAISGPSTSRGQNADAGPTAGRRVRVIYDPRDGGPYPDEATEFAKLVEAGTAKPDDDFLLIVREIVASPPRQQEGGGQE